MIPISAERRLLQAIVAFACLVPLSAGVTGVVVGPGFAGATGVGTDLDSHFRYLSGLLLGIGVAFGTCIPAIERHGARIRLLGAIVVIGGLARLWSAIDLGLPTTGHRFGLVMELLVVPSIVAWQAGFAARWERARPTG